MNWPMDLLLAGFAFLGHFSLAVWLYNRLHAINWPVPTIKLLEKLLLLLAAAVMGLFIARWLVTGHGLFSPPKVTRLADHGAWLAYAMVCWASAAAVVPCWLLPKLRERLPAELVSNDTAELDVIERLGIAPVHGLKTRLLSRFPGNEIFRLAIQRKTLLLDRLPPELDGFTIAHLSDLHMTGHIGREFYDLVVDETNRLSPDLIAVTGDILEKPCCLPWIASTLGRLQAPSGRYFVLGNHEKRLAEVRPLREALTAAGLIDLGSRCERVTLRGASVLLAGNELPWFGTAPECGSREAGEEFRLLLAHTPDQLPWAQSNRFNLMLAGHNHGGQIRLPFVGALITPSLYGWRYAGGLYHEPPTLMHVSRGVAGVHPLRLNCPPELALLVLKAGPRSLR